MKKLKFLLIIFIILSPLLVSSRAEVEDWYIKDYFVEFKINSDSSIEVKENIVADSGDNLRHGIFRVLDTRGIRISDIEVKDHPFSINRDNNSINIKIGDPEVFVSGENFYDISYTIKGAFLKQSDYDELYYNILGHSWDLEIDNFKAHIIFPDNLTKDNIDLSLYTGLIDQTANDLINYQWLNENTLEINSTRTILKNEGITLSASFPPDLIEIKNDWFFSKTLNIFIIIFFVSPLFVIIIALMFLRSHQRKNPYYKRVIVPQYQAPDNLSPIKLGLLNGKKINYLITATIVRFASLKLITISDKEKNVLLFKNKTLEFKKTNNQEYYSKLDEIEKYIFDLIFTDKNIVETKDLKKIFSIKAGEISFKTKTILEKDAYINKGYNKTKLAFIIIGVILFFLLSIISAIALFIIQAYIKNHTEKGKRVAWETKGLLMYLKVAETERHKFYEKENIFTNLLPYAIAFNMTSRFLKKMASIYGEDEMKKNLVWYSSYQNINSFNLLSKQLNSVSNSASSGGSGAGGGGRSGGGFGGGGGGGW